MLSQLNKTYISDALAEKLEHISDNAVTTIVAPMGYGKTKAVDWWISRHSGDEGILCLRQIITTDSLNDFWQGLCRNFRGDGELYSEMTALGFPSEIRACELMLGILEDALRRLGREVFYFLDDVHFISSEKLPELIAFLCDHMPRGLHLVLLSRNTIVRQIRKDGTEVWVEIKACSLSEYSFGQELFTYCRDVTQRIETEHRYAEEVAIRDASLRSMFASIHFDLTDNAVLRYRDLSAVNGRGYSGETASQILGQLADKIPKGEGYSSFRQQFNRNALVAAFDAGDILGSVKAFNTVARRWLRCEYVLVRNRYNEHIELLVYIYDIQSQVLTEKMMGMISEQFFDYIGLIDVDEKTIEAYFMPSCSDGQAAEEKTDYKSLCEEKLRLLFPPDEVSVMQELLSLDNICGRLKKSPYFSVALPADGLAGNLRPKRIVFAFLDETKRSIIVAQENIGPVLTQHAGRK